MTSPRVCVLRAPGTNCDLETGYAFELAAAQVDNVHLFELAKQPERLKNYQILCIPGGFSYGDDIGAGVIFAGQIRRQLDEMLHEFLSRDTLTLGICNGFQVLMKAGILPGSKEQNVTQVDEKREVTLTWNDNGKYTARWVQLVCDNSQSQFLKGIDTIELPIAHAEGKICVSDQSLPAQWRESGQIGMRYCNESGDACDDILPDSFNPNGSVANIAGLSDPTGRVLGLMPHPERFIKATQHPQWTRHNLTGQGDGLKIFKNATRYFQS